MITRDDTERGGRLLARLMEEVGHRQGDLGPSRLLVVTEQRHTAKLEDRLPGCCCSWMDGRLPGRLREHRLRPTDRPHGAPTAGRVCGRSRSPPHRRSLRADGTGGCALDGAADPADGRSCGLLRCGNCVPTRSRQHAARARPHARWARPGRRWRCSRPIPRDRLRSRHWPQPRSIRPARSSIEWTRPSDSTVAR